MRTWPCILLIELWWFVEFGGSTLRNGRENNGTMRKHYQVFDSIFELKCVESNDMMEDSASYSIVKDKENRESGNVSMWALISYWVIGAGFVFVIFGLAYTWGRRVGRRSRAAEEILTGLEVVPFSSDPPIPQNEIQVEHLKSEPSVPAHFKCLLWALIEEVFFFGPEEQTLRGTSAPTTLEADSETTEDETALLREDSYELGATAPADEDDDLTRLEPFVPPPGTLLFTTSDPIQRSPVSRRADSLPRPNMSLVNWDENDQVVPQIPDSMILESQTVGDNGALAIMEQEEEQNERMNLSFD